MKTTALIFVSLLTFKFGTGQLINDRKLFDIVPIHLGDSISRFEPDLRAITAFGNDTSSSKSYQYTAALKKPFIVSSISFKNALFDFDSRNKLTRFNLTKAYFDDKGFKTNSRQEYNRLISYLVSVLGEEGDTKIFYRQVLEGRQWDIGDKILFVDLQATGVANSTSVGITIFRK